MKKFIPVLFLIMLTTGCGIFDGGWFWFDPPAPPLSPPMPSQPQQPHQMDMDEQQLADAKESFKEKLNDSNGLSLKGLLKKWGKLEPGVSRSGLTVYRWSQTASLMLPSDADNSDGEATAQTASCLAMFIVGPDNEVVDATAEGQCFDYNLMPVWNPIITQSTDGKIGPVR